MDVIDIRTNKGLPLFNINVSFVKGMAWTEFILDIDIVQASKDKAKLVCLENRNVFAFWTSRYSENMLLNL